MGRTGSATSNQASLRARTSTVVGEPNDVCAGSVMIGDASPIAAYTARSALAVATSPETGVIAVSVASSTTAAAASSLTSTAVVVGDTTVVVDVTGATRGSAAAARAERECTEGGGSEDAVDSGDAHDALLSSRRKR